MVRTALLIVVAVGTAAAASDSDAAIEIPFSFEHNEILVQVRFGRQAPVTMMLDTNTDPSTIDLAFARSNGLKLREVHGQVTGGGTEQQQIYLTRLEQVVLGALPAKDLQAVAIDLSRIRDRLGAPVQGVLGNNFLAGRVVQIDYPGKMLRFYRSWAAKSGQAAFPFRYGDDGDILTEGVAINGQRVKATFDTGSDGTFALTPAAVESLGLTDAASHGRPETSYGYKGAAPHTRGKVDRIAVGSIEIASPEVIFWGKGRGRDRRPWELNIGNAFLKDYILTLDYPRKRLTLQKP